MGQFVDSSLGLKKPSGCVSTSGLLLGPIVNVTILRLHLFCGCGQHYLKINRSIAGFSFAAGSAHCKAVVSSFVVLQQLLTLLLCYSKPMVVTVTGLRRKSTRFRTIFDGSVAYSHVCLYAMVLAILDTPKSISCVYCRVDCSTQLHHPLDGFTASIRSCSGC